MWIEETRIGVLIALWGVSIIFTSVGWFVEYPPELIWLRFILQAFAVVFTLFAVIYTIDSMWGRFTIRVTNYQRAKVTHMIQLADTLRGLTPRQTEIIDKYDQLAIIGSFGISNRVAWYVKGIRLDVPLELLQDFLIMSQETDPRLLPIREHTQFTKETGWTNAEENLTEATRILINAGLAEYDKPTRSAKLTVPWIELAESIGIERNILT